jgi:hypothetical protein
MYKDLKHIYIEWAFLFVELRKTPTRGSEFGAGNRTRGIMWPGLHTPCFEIRIAPGDWCDIGEAVPGTTHGEITCRIYVTWA